MSRFFSRRTFSFFLTFIFFILKSLTSEAASILSTSKRLNLFVSGWSQTYVLKQSGDYIAPNAITVDNKSFNFSCPGPSFLVGLQTEYKNGVRRFRFACHFFEDAKGNLVSTTQTKCNAKGWDNNLLQNTGKSACTANQFVQGMNGLYHINAGGGAAQIDEQFRAICCPPELAQGSISSSSCGPTMTLNNPLGNTILAMCPANMAMHEINTALHISGTQSDRVFTFRCCNMQLN